MVTSLASPPDECSRPDVLFCCLIGAKFGDLNSMSFIRLIASSPLTQGQGSHSDQIIRAALIKWELGLPQTSGLVRELSPFTQQIFTCLGA